MDAELEKLVEAGKLTTKAAEKLEQLRPGAFCLHKSWGFGQVAEWNLLLNQIVIDFKTKAKHPMQLAYAAENLIPIPAGHFLARKVKEPDVIKALLKSDPVAVVRNILEGFDGKATLAQISEVQHEFSDPKTQLQPIVERIENTAAQNQKLHSPLTFELVLARDELLQRVPELRITRPDLTLERLISEEESRLTEILPK